MIDLNQSGVICVQQRCTGSGVFDGTAVGYATRAYSQGGGAGTFRARTVGTDGNLWKVQLVDVGHANATTTVKLSGHDVLVLCKRNASAITALLSEVAAALAAFRGPVSASFDAGNVSATTPGPSPVLLGVTTDATVTALSLAALAGGIDPTYQGNILRFDPATNTHVGLFFFEAPEAIEILQVDASATITGLDIVNVNDGLGTISGETASVLSILNTRPILLGTKQALKVTIASAATVRVWARRASRRQ